MEGAEEKQKKPVAAGKAPRTQKLLTGKHWWGIVLAAIAVVFSVIGNIWVHEYFQPDVRYEEGTWYYPEGKGIISLRIKNYGAADAEKIVFTVSFEETISNASVNDATVECMFEKQEEPRTITGRIARLVPGQTALVYYDIGPIWAGRVFNEGSFVRKMVYNGGMGRVGEPHFLKWLMSLASGALGAGLVATGQTLYRLFLRRVTPPCMR